MNFFFVRDHHHKHRFFSAEPPGQIPVKFSRTKEIWEKAKKKIMVLPQKTLRQEEAFGRVLRIKDESMTIFHSGLAEDRKLKMKFFFFLQRQKTKHVLYLVGESLFLPISGLAAFLPGPNIFFYALALLMIVHWQAFRGITRLRKKNHVFVVDPLLTEWEKAVEDKKENLFPFILEKLEKKHALNHIHKVLWK